LEAQLADVRKQVAAHKRAREQADERVAQMEADMLQWQKKAEESAAELESCPTRRASKALAQQRGEKPFDWTTYGIDEELEGEDVDEQVRIEYLTTTTEQLRSHCQTLEIENNSMKDLMAAFELSLEQHAQVIGHVNHKQKIRYTLQLKETINRLLEELRRSRSRIFQLEEWGRNKTGEESPLETKQDWTRSLSSVHTTTTTTKTTMTTQAHERVSRRKSCH